MNSSTLDKQLKDIAARFNAIPIKLNNLEIGKRGEFKGLGQNIPYVQLKVLTSGTLNKDVEGMIGVASTPDKKNEILVSISDPGKYKQDIAEKFFKNIKLATTQADK